MKSFYTLLFIFSIYFISCKENVKKEFSAPTLPDFKEEESFVKEGCPGDSKCFHDYDEGITFAKTHEKPILLYFTGWTCINCLLMEKNVWSNPAILKTLTQNYILISLYVDDKKLVPDIQKKLSEDKKEIKTLGQKWSNMLSSIYKTDVLPYYVIMNNKEKVLSNPLGGIISFDDYVRFLDEGIDRNYLSLTDNPVVY